MGGIMQSLALMTVERYFSLLLSFTTMAAVSRILTPTEVGIAVMGWALLSIPFALRDLGTSDFIVQRRELSAEDTRCAAYVGLLSALALFAAIVALTPAIVALYGDARIGEFLHVIVFAILTDAAGGPVLALMRRDLAFRSVVCVNAIVSVTTSAVTIGFALLGFSYMCVAWAALISNASAAVLALCLRPSLWVFRPSLRHRREVVGFGMYYSAMAALMRAYEALPYLALGRFSHASAIGHYNRAVQACQLPDKVILSGIAAIAFPTLAAEARKGRGLKMSYFKAIEYMTAVQWPGLVLLACLAPRVVQVLYGQQWSQVVPLVQIMALAWAFGAASVLTYPVLYAAGNLPRALRMTLVSLPSSALIMLAAAPFGATAMALSLLLTIPLNNVVALWFIRSHLLFEWAELWAAVRRSVVVTSLSAAGPLCVLAAMQWQFEQPLWIQGLIVLLAGIGWLLGLWVSNHPILAVLGEVTSAVCQRLGAAVSLPKTRSRPL
jgi:O-antigen/teichoic acid export membrane protein